LESELQGRNEKKVVVELNNEAFQFFQAQLLVVRDYSFPKKKEQPIHNTVYNDFFHGNRRVCESKMWNNQPKNMA